MRQRLSDPAIFIRMSPDSYKACPKDDISWLTDYPDTINAVCALLTRDLTPEERVQFDISDEERTPFVHVQANGGTLAWDLFDQDFGNDLD
jgi:hypothetical protein